MHAKVLARKGGGRVAQAPPASTPTMTGAQYDAWLRTPVAPAVKAVRTPGRLRGGEWIEGELVRRAV